MTAPADRWSPVAVRLSPEVARTLARVGRTWLAVAVLAFVAFAVTIGVPLDPEGGTLGPQYAEPLQYLLLGVEVVALGLSWRWKAIETVLAGLGGAGLALLAAYEYPPLIAAAVAIAFVVPAVLLWLAWHPRESTAAVTGLALATSLLLGGAWVGATTIYDTAFGPTHPESTTAAVSAAASDWMWAGAVDTDGFTVVAGGIDGATARVVTVAEDGGGFGSAAAVASPVTAVDDGTARIPVGGLEAGTRYRYALEIDGALDEARTGHLATFPAGPADLTIAVSSCARTGSNGAVFDAIRRSAPDLYVVTGDFHYENIARNEVGLFRRAYEAQLRRPAQAALYGAVPVAYVWDDHDFGPNNSDASAPSAPAARAAYETFAPHYPLLGETIHQAFTMGRVRIVLTDTRSARDPAAGTMLGRPQVEWLKAELLAASRSHALVLWVNPTPWIAESGEDSWAGYAAERRELADFVAANGIANLLMLSGDAHMVAIDDGRNNVFSSEGGPGFPVFHAAPLDRRGSIKGGPYSHGVAASGGQYGLVTVEDDGTTVMVTLEGRDYADRVLVSHSFVAASVAP